MKFLNNKDKPLAYRFGGCFFCEWPFYVNKNVLIPRFDTELLVQQVIKTAKEGTSILDLCTGSGCIAVVLAKHDLKVTANDKSNRALRVARKNARLHNVDIEFVRGDLFNTKKFSQKKFDIIVSNPPYIKTSELGKHDKSTLHEPKIALDGGLDGLEFYKRIISAAGDYLADGGKLFLEVGYNQSTDVQNILRENNFRDITAVRDMQNYERVLGATKN